ncbi:hypothetical protein HX001_14380 [Empedobacter brevis]|uniref:Uncharacterized protein n=1 Tax=Empedobacter brevis TaxID=247 RepID=A0AAJ1QGI3_9FLAO|nr:hypothetical protein [Empedobacter brevis]MDM1073673.1 hypothetical protein [Empedobacter brevis]
MILTAKAEEDYFDWLDNQGVNGIDISNWEFEKFNLLSKVSQNALIIEWFDSVGIYVNVVRLNSIWNYSFWFNHNRYQGYDFKTRQEATEQAIIKANEIYNERKY